ncbi:MAG: helix-turn-helix domain-containing protein [Firmicutes bacterium]|nr:helix-turn-helix domain-containing protein [Bacillota bacterium]
MLTPLEVARILRIGRNRVYEEIRYGELCDIAIKLGRLWRIPKAALKRRMDEGKKPTWEIFDGKGKKA